MSDLLNRDKSAIWHPFTQLTSTLDPLPIESADGVYLNTTDGRKILDAISSWWVNLHGHSHPYIADAIAKQAEKLEHVIFAGFTHEPAIQLAENLLSILPKNQSKIFFSDNGSTAVEVGLKMAFQFWHNQQINKRKIIAFNGSYHGDTFGAMAVGDRGPFSAPFSPYLFDVEFIDSPTDYNWEEVKGRFKALVDSKEVGAFIFEPLVLGSAGMRMHKSEYLDELIQYAQQLDVICIADEVFTGFGRTGKLFASDYLINKPDIMALSKGLTGGTMALGVTSCTERIIDAYRSNDIMKTFFHGHSFTANPIACAAANASFDLLMESNCQKAIEDITAWQHEHLNELKNHNRISNVRQLGTILAFEINTKAESSYVNEVRHKLYPYFLDRDILLRPLGNTIYVLPPYVINRSEMQMIYTAINELLASDLI